jgi:hypothetical protein
MNPTKEIVSPWCKNGSMVRPLEHALIRAGDRENLAYDTTRDKANSYRFSACRNLYNPDSIKINLEYAKVTFAQKAKRNQILTEALQGVFKLMFCLAEPSLKAFLRLTCHVNQSQLIGDFRPRMDRIENACP